MCCQDSGQCLWCSLLLSGREGPVRVGSVGPGLGWGEVAERGVESGLIVEANPFANLVFRINPSGMLLLIIEFNFKGCEKRFSHGVIIACRNASFGSAADLGDSGYVVWWVVVVVIFSCSVGLSV